MSDAPYFRAGAGAVIYTETGEIVIFRRAGEEDIWQLQQGGMDANETPEDTLWRELYEETDLLKANFIEVTPYPDWILYSYPPEVRTTLKRPDTLGQVHRWWFLKLNPEVKIDITKAQDQEFSDWKLVDFDELLAARTTGWKFEVYKKLSDYFTDHIKPTLK